MGKQFCIPKIIDGSIWLNNIEISKEFIFKLYSEEFLSTSDIAEIVSSKVSSVVSRGAISKIVKYYELDTSETILRRKLATVKKTEESNLKKYGVKNVYQLDTVKQKLAQTKQDRYGNSSFVNPEKAKTTCLSKYGVSNYSSTLECREKVKTTNLERYGTETPAESEVVRNKMKQTCLEKYGVDNIWKSINFLEDRQQVFFDKNPTLTDTFKKIYRDRLLVQQEIRKLPTKTIIDIADYFGIPNPNKYAKTRQWLFKLDLIEEIDNFKSSSHYEDEIIQFIGENLCEKHNRTILDGKEIDVFIPSKNLAIEFNGTYWHSSMIKTDKNYHLNKSKLAESKGIRLIHIYEYEWLDDIQREKIKMMLNIALGRCNNRIYAKNCEVRKISNTEARALNNQIHLQNHRNALITYGLFHNNELVQLMSFSKTKYNKNLKTDNSWEIIRGCPGSNNLVVGGVSKLFTHFIRENDPEVIFSYCDFNKFNGRSYEAIGMKFIGYTGPDMKWLMEDGSIVNRCPSKHKELKEHSIGQIFGAGSKKYLWTRD